MIIKIFIYWRAGLLLLTYFGTLIYPKVLNIGFPAEGFEKNLNYLESLVQWDGGHYLSIAKYGYQISEETAFFPLYPLFIKFLSLLYKNEFFWGLIVSNASLLIFLYFFFKIVKKKCSWSVAYNTLISFLVFPTAFFTTIYYSESLFLLMVILTFYFLESKKFHLSALFISLAGLTRIVGAGLILSIFYKYFSSIDFRVKKINVKIIYPLLSTFGILGYCLYLLSKTGDPFSFLNVQTMWGRSVSDPMSTLLSYIWTFLSGDARPFTDYLDFFLTAAFLAILITGVKKIPSSWWIFSMLVILIPASSGTLTSMPRYLIASIGTFVVIGKFLDTNPHLKIPLWSSSIILQIILYIRFLNGYWVS